MEPVNVLIFPAGEINAMELHDALSHNVNIRLFGCSSVSRHGSYVFKNYRDGLPNIEEEDFIQKFNNLIEEWDIQYIFPTHDTVALYLAKNKALINAKVIVSNYETAQVCRDKRIMYDLFSDCDFCPKQYTNFDNLPVFIKPRIGQGAKDTKLIMTNEDIPKNISVKDYTINEYLPGTELTVDCLTDSKGKICACLPRIRSRILAGVCVEGKPIEATEEIFKIASEINNRLQFLGLWYFQIKKSAKGRYKLLEISTRCAGSMCLSRARGINLPLLSVYIAQGRDISVIENPFSITMDRTLISRYKISYKYNKVFIDYDDTVIEGKQVCLPAIKFLYQCKNKGIEIVLLTRHEEYHQESVEESLSKHAISNDLFDKIIKIRIGQDKSDFISDESIFIDNSYSERKAVYDRIGIPVFDVEGIEVLEDWRC